MIIKKLKIKNFKKHASITCDFNDDINLIVGDNESGKSSILEAIEICLNFSHRGKPLNSELSTDLFNIGCIKEFLKGDLSQNTLPEILIEIFLEGCTEHKGNNNSEKTDTEGLFVKISFNPELSDSYAAFIENPDEVLTLPIELYKLEWYSFSWNRITHHNKKINCLFVDPSRLHPTFGRSVYINNIINAALDSTSRSTLNLNYRQLKTRFNEEKEVVAINSGLDEKNKQKKNKQDIKNKKINRT